MVDRVRRNSGVHAGQERQLTGCRRFDFTRLGPGQQQPKNESFELAVVALYTLRKIDNDRCGLSCLSKIAHM